MDAQRFCKSPCSEVGGYRGYFKGKKHFPFASPWTGTIKEPLLSFPHTSTHWRKHERDCRSWKAWIVWKQGVLMKRVLQFNCSGCAFVCAKKWKCWRPKCFLYPQNSEQYKLPWPVLPRCPRPASPCRALALCSLGPIPWTLSLQPSSLAGLSRNTIFCIKDLSWVPECPSLKVFVHITDSLHLGRPLCPLQCFWESWLSGWICTSPCSQCSACWRQGACSSCTLPCQPLWSSPWIPVWCQGAKCPVPFCSSLLSYPVPHSNMIHFK